MAHPSPDCTGSHKRCRSGIGITTTGLTGYSANYNAGPTESGQRKNVICNINPVSQGGHYTSATYNCISNGQ